MRSQITSLFVCAVVAGCGGPPSPGPDPLPVDGLHTIRLTRPARVGESYELEYVGESERRFRIVVEDEVTRDDHEVRRVVLRGRATVRAVTDGDASEYDVTVERCTSRLGREEHEVVPPGSVLRVFRSRDDGRIELVGGVLPEDDVEALSLVISTQRSGVDDDDVFGTDRPQAVGARWPIDAARAARELDEMDGIDVAASDVDGQSQLVDEREVDGVPCLHIAVSMRAHGFDMQVGEESVTEHAEIAMDVEGSYPIESSIDRLRDHFRMTTDVRVRLGPPDAHVGLLEIADRRDIRRVYRR